MIVAIVDANILFDLLDLELTEDFFRLDMDVYTSDLVINEIKNAISSRFIDIVRSEGSITYRNACDGLNKGVDRRHRSMNDFLSSIILPELLVMGKVGVFVDRLPRTMNTVIDSQLNQPYLYYYKAEDILTWTTDSACAGGLSQVDGRTAGPGWTSAR